MSDNSNKGLASADEETRQRVAREGGESRNKQGGNSSKMDQKGGSASHGKSDEGEQSEE